jgi:hypothetical protein
MTWNELYVIMQGSNDSTFDGKFTGKKVNTNSGNQKTRDPRSI